MTAGPATTPAPPSIGDYALFGDCRTAALVSRDGSIDWLCFPRFDSPSVFAAILDQERGGRFRVQPVGTFGAEHRYLPGTNILETTMRGASGSCIVRDLMPVASEGAKRNMLTPERQVLREIEVLSGEVDIEVVYAPRPDYGRMPARLEDRGIFGIACDAGRGQLLFRTDLPVTVASDRASAGCVARVAAGERYYLSLTYDEDAPAIVPALGEAAAAKVEQSAAWWRDWALDCRYQGRYRDAVARSALVLKLLTYAPSGAIVAAPTTSLPEHIGGPRNWDYRYCWLRDASFTVRALLSLGFREEAEAFLDWVLHATRLSAPELQVVYNVYGETRLPERELDHLRGYARSRPVRIGNDAHGQLQLDVYGEVIDAAARLSRPGQRFDRETARMLRDLGDTVCRRWREPDEGIWEGRAGRSHNTHSKVLCWVALDRLLAMHADGRLTVDAPRLRAERAAIADEIERHGFNERRNSYTSTFDGEHLDASLLVLPLYGYIDAAHPRMRSTIEAILDELGEDGLVYRYDASTADGLPPGEGAFGICSFWAVECLALAGDVGVATAMFERLLEYQNDVGLYAEEIDPRTGAALGNFPQAFTHVGLINAALTLGLATEGTGRPDGAASMASVEEPA